MNDIRRWLCTRRGEGSSGSRMLDFWLVRFSRFFAAPEHTVDIHTENGNIHIECAARLLASSRLCWLFLLVGWERSNVYGFAWRTEQKTLILVVVHVNENKNPVLASRQDSLLIRASTREAHKKSRWVFHPPRRSVGCRLFSLWCFTFPIFLLRWCTLWKLLCNVSGGGWWASSDHTNALHSHKRTLTQRAMQPQPLRAAHHHPSYPQFHFHFWKYFHFLYCRCWLCERHELTKGKTEKLELFFQKSTPREKE